MGEDKWATWKVADKNLVADVFISAEVIAHVNTKAISPKLK